MRCDYMRDDSFKQAFLNGRYPLKQSKQDDRVIVMLEYKKQEKNGEVEQKEVCVHTVYSFNDTEIVPLPKEQVRCKAKRNGRGVFSSAILASPRLACRPLVRAGAPISSAWMGLTFTMSSKASSA